MSFPRLTLRVATPFLLLVLVATVVLDLYLGELLASEQRRRFRDIAVSNARFLTERRLSPSASLAADLRSVTGLRVFFRGDGVRLPELQPAPGGDLGDLPLTTIPADGAVRRHGELEYVAVPITPWPGEAHGRADLLLMRARTSTLFDPRVLGAIGLFQLATLATAWIVVRGLARPLGRLARQLPTIDDREPGEVPEARRRDEIGDVARAFVATREALQRERQDRERVEKLAVLGRMTAALAHEVQNPVAAIRMHAQLLRRGGEVATAAIIEHEAARISDLLDQWMFLTRPQAPSMSALPLAPLLGRAVDVHRAQAEHAAARCELQVEPGLTVRGDERRLEQVFRNLIVNAIQAMRSGGRVRIEARADGDAAVVTIADDGPGFSRSALARLGEFFYSEREGGMGIGLSVASEIVKAHGGSLDADNAAAGGAVVTVRLPRAIDDGA